MITELRAGYAKIQLMDGSLIPGSGTQKDTAHLASNNWIAVYHLPKDEFARHQDLDLLQLKGAPIPYTKGIGHATADLNFETGRAERSLPFEIRLLKEGMCPASGAILRSMFQNVRIQKATFDFTKQSGKGEEQIAFQIEITDGAFSEWEVFQEGGGSKKVETLEYVSIVASQWTFLKEAVWADTDGEKRVFGGFDYEKRAKI